MKKTQKIGIIALITGIALVFAFTACGDGSGGTGGGTGGNGGGNNGGNGGGAGAASGNVFTCYDEDFNMYTLTLPDSGARAAVLPKAGESYEITVTGPGGSKIGTNKGRITQIEGSTLTLKGRPDGSDTFTVETTEGNKILRFPGAVDLGDGKVHQVKGNLSYTREKVKIDEVTVPGNNLKEKLEWIGINVKSNTRYTVEVNNDEMLTGMLGAGGSNYLFFRLEYARRCNVTVLLKGSGTISVSPVGNTVLFWVRSGITLEMEDITIKGAPNVSGVVTDGGSFTMQGNVKFINFDIAHSAFQVGYGTFIMKDNADVTGTGYVWGTFIMRDNAKIHGGIEYSLSLSGTFQMNDNAEIYEIGYVFFGPGTFTMNSGKIRNNTNGGVRTHGNFIMNGGEIYGNTASTFGGGGVILVSSFGFGDGTFTMKGGKIYNNSSNSDGGGVYVGYTGTFIMEGGEIYGNTASNSGGGVFVNDVAYIGANTYPAGTFTKTGGTIYGKNEGVNSNTATKGDTNGHAVYVSSSPSKYRDTTASPTVYLNTADTASWNQ
jgi:hypothetical protein